MDFIEWPDRPGTSKPRAVDTDPRQGAWAGGRIAVVTVLVSVVLLVVAGTTQAGAARADRGCVPGLTEQLALVGTHLGPQAGGDPTTWCQPSAW